MYCIGNGKRRGLPLATLVTVALDVLKEDADCLELKHTVPALSIGRQCAAYGYRFTWEPWALAPTFLTPEGEAVDIEVKTCAFYRCHCRLLSGNRSA